MRIKKVGVFALLATLLAFSGWMMFGNDSRVEGSYVGNQRIESFATLHEEMKEKQASLKSEKDYEEAEEVLLSSEFSEDILYERALDESYEDTYIEYIEALDEHYILPRHLSESELEAFNINREFDLKVFNEWLLHYVNELRRGEGVSELVYGPHLEEGGRIRVKELNVDGSIYVVDKETGELKPEKHIRPEWEGYTMWHTAFEHVLYEHTSIGENLAMRSWTGNPYILASEKRLAQIAFEDWESSPPHRENMVMPTHVYMYGDVQLTSELRTGSPLDKKMGGYIFGQWFSN